MKPACAIVLIGLVMIFDAIVVHGQQKREIEDITGRYSFLKPDDLLGILDEDGELRGFIEILQEDDESDDIFSYTITRGVRKDNQINFKTDTIHGITYRFSGKVQISKKRNPTQRGFMLLVGTIQIEKNKFLDGKGITEERKVVLESLASE